MATVNKQWKLAPNIFLPHQEELSKIFTDKVEKLFTGRIGSTVTPAWRGQKELAQRWLEVYDGEQ